MSESVNEQLAALAAQVETPKPSWARHAQVLPDVGGDFTDAVLEMLRALEADWETRGWDQPHQVGLLMGTPASGDEQAYLSVMAFGPPIYGDLVLELIRAVRVLAKSPPAVAGEWLGELPGKVLAAVVAVEVWTVPDAVVPADGTRASQRDDRVEKRLVFSVDLDGGLLGVQRVRGELPRLLPAGAPPPGMGTMVEAVEMLAAVVRLAQDGKLGEAMRRQ